MKKLAFLFMACTLATCVSLGFTSDDESEKGEKHSGYESSEVMDGDDVLVEKPGDSMDDSFKAGTPLENLQAAYNGESNAHAKYAAFAKKAEEEGYGAVASLFRAASRAEKIHAENHAEVIRSLGAEPVADVKTPEVKTTAENLKAAIAGETFERDVMYPAYLQIAR